MSKAKALEISADLSFPIDAVTETFWWLGIRGSGKTHDCSVFVEELLGVGAQVIVLDPMHAWWGLRSNAAGTGPGFEIPIFGGARGDVPLEPTAGRFMANLAINEGVSMILDVKRWARAERRRFVTDFLARLLEANNRTPMHVVLEEAPLFAPQRPQKGDETMLGVVEEFVRLGRGDGLGCSLISQRSATINKEVSTQTEVLVAHRVRAPQDIKAVKEWFDAHDHEGANDAARRLPHLKTGAPIVTSPSFLDFFGEVTFRKRTTFDSSITPKVGETKREAKTLADVDLDAIKEQMAETIEKAKATDPKELQKRIKELERQLRDTEQDIEWREVEVPVEVPVLDREGAALMQGLLDAFGPAQSVIKAALQRFNSPVVSAPEAQRIPAPRIPGHVRTVDKPKQPAAVKPHTVPRPRADTSSDSTLTGPMRKLLTVLVVYGPRTKRQLAMQAGYAMGGGGFNNPLGALRSAGYATKGEPIEATQEGIDALGDYDPLPTGQALIDHWMGQLSGPEKKILQPLINAHPSTLTKDELADAAGYAPVGGGFNNPLGRLRTLQLVTKGPDIGLTDDFAEAIG